MDQEIDRTISLLTTMLTRSTKADDALKLTQAALNLAHVKHVLMSVSQGEPRNKTKAA